MESLFSFFGVLLIAVLFSQLFFRMKIPWVVGLLIGGIAIGPSGFGIYEADPTIEFFAMLGLIFLMFMAGLESKFTGAAGLGKKIVIAAFLVGVIPALAGFLLVHLLGYSFATAVLVGIVFMSSAVALLIPQFEEQNILKSELGQVVILTAMAIDAVSLILLAIFLQWSVGTLSLVSVLVYILVGAFLYMLAKLIPKIRFLTFEEDYAEQHDLYEKELRFLIFILVGFVILFELIGLHAIVASFFAGVILTGSLKSRLLKVKLHAVGYGFLIPIFFITIGASVDMRVLFENRAAFFIMLIVVGTLIVSKFVGGWIAGKLNGFTNRASTFLGLSALPQLSTALAVTFLGYGQGLLDEILLASIVALSVVTALVAPLILSYIGKNLPSQTIIISSAHDQASVESVK